MKPKFTQSVRQHRLIAFGAALLVLLAVAAGAFFIWRGSQPVKPGVQTIPILGSTGSPSVTGVSSSGSSVVQASIRLSQGQAQLQSVAPITLLTGDPLAPDAIQNILARLPSLPVDPSTQVDFKLPANPIPPPRPGLTITLPFPPAATSNPVGPVAAGPLQVLRYSPEGEIPIAPFINITFNQPMVELTTLTDLSSKQVPVQVDPPLPGT